MQKTAISFWMIVVAAGTPSALGAGVRYTLTNLGVAREGDTWSAAGYINEAGQVVVYSGAAMEGRAYLRTAGEWVDPMPGWASTGIRALNERGDVVGIYSVDGYWARYIYSDGVTTVLTDRPGTVSESVNDINDVGDMVWTDRATSFLQSNGSGASVELSMPGRPFLIDNAGRMLASVGSAGSGQSPHALIYSADGRIEARIEVPGAKLYASEMNEIGEAVGTVYPDEWTSNGFWYHGGSAFVLPRLRPDGQGSAGSLNNHGVVVGAERDSAGAASVGTIWRDGTVTDVNGLIDGAPGWHVFALSDVNDKGVIVGRALWNGLERAVVLTPVPEPAWPWSIGAACVAGAARRPRVRRAAAGCKPAGPRR
jgi:hypothetical protein